MNSEWESFNIRYNKALYSSEQNGDNDDELEKMPKEKFGLLAKIVVPLHVFKSVYNKLGNEIEPYDVQISNEIKVETIQFALLFNKHLQDTKDAIESVITV